MRKVIIVSLGVAALAVPNIECLRVRQGREDRAQEEGRHRDEVLHWHRQVRLTAGATSRSRSS